MCVKSNEKLMVIKIVCVSVQLLMCVFVMKVMCVMAWQTDVMVMCNGVMMLVLMVCVCGVCVAMC